MHKYLAKLTIVGFQFKLEL